MSTKIYNGYRLANSDGTRPELLAFTDRLRTTFTEVFEELYAQYLTRLAVLEHDKAVSNGDPAPSRALATAHRWVLQEHRNVVENGRRSPSADLSVQVAFMSDPADAASHPGPVYAVVYTERTEYLTAFETLPEVSSFAYWNSSDGPEDISAEDWKLRGEIWDRVLARKPPVERGVTFDLFGSYLPIRPETVRDRVAAHIGDRADRAHRLAVHNVPTVDIEVNPPDSTDPRDVSIEIREHDVVEADIAAETARVLPLLDDLDTDTLYGTSATV